MRSLRDAGLSVVLISSNMDLLPDSVAAAKEICSAVMLRENRGWDFAGWAPGMKTLTGIYDAAEIVIANDSVYGPVHSLKDAFNAMNGPRIHASKDGNRIETQDTSPL
jgi:lipopolysaccharide biosynthesis protein